MALLKSILTPDHVWNAPVAYDKPTPSPKRLERIARLEGARQSEERLNERLNAIVKAKYGALSAPEPKSIHSPAPKPKIERVPPRKRAEPTQSTDKAGKSERDVAFRIPEKRHPNMPPKLSPYLSRFYEKD